MERGVSSFGRFPPVTRRVNKTLAGSRYAGINISITHANEPAGATGKAGGGDERARTRRGRGCMQKSHSGVWGFYGPTNFFNSSQETKKVPVNASHVRLQPRDKAAELAELDRAKRHKRRGRKRVWRTAMKAES